MKTFTEAYEFLLSVIANVPYGVISVDMDGYVTMINDAALQNLEIQGETKLVLETNILDHLRDLPALEEVLVSCFNQGREEFELTELLFNKKYLNVNGKPILNGMLISVNDVSENKKAQLDATRSLLKGQEMERRRLAKEIHDGIGPLMSTIRLNLDAVKNELSEAPPKTLKKVNTMEELIQNVSTDIRSISHALMPSALIDFGVVEAIKNLCNKANASEKLEIEFYHAGIKKRLDRNYELNIYRIAQELLNNSIKYADAKSVHIQLTYRKNKITLSVEDDGKGFDRNQLDEMIQNGIGLRNIKTRVSSLGGTFSIDTQKGKGVFSIIEIPVPS